MSHITVVDDDKDMLLLTSRWLEKTGYKVSKAASGKEALDLILAEKPDLVLLDYCMPEMDGPEVLKAIRSSDSIKNIPVLYRTGMDDISGEDKSEPAPNGIVSKADGKPGLLKAVEAALQNN